MSDTVRLKVVGLISKTSNGNWDRKYVVLQPVVNRGKSKTNEIIGAPIEVPFTDQFPEDLKLGEIYDLCHEEG